MSNESKELDLLCLSMISSVMLVNLIFGMNLMLLGVACMLLIVRVSTADIATIKKVAIIASLAVFYLLSVVWADHLLKENTEEVSDTSTLVDDYMKAFIKGDYTSCDSMVLYPSDKIMPGDSESTGTYTKSGGMYTELMYYVGKSIEDIKYDAQTSTLKVRYKPYKKIDAISVDEKKVDDLVNKYVTNQLSDQDLKTGIEDIYYDTFKNIIIPDEDSDLKVFETEISIESDKLVGTYDFIEGMLKETHLYENMGVYESTMKSTLDVLLRK